MADTRLSYVRELNRGHASGRFRLKHDAAWRRVALRHLPDGMRFPDLYARMGWSNGIAANRRRYGFLMLQEAAQMAKALRVDLGEFLVALAHEEGIPNLGERVRVRSVKDGGA